MHEIIALSNIKTTSALYKLADDLLKHKWFHFFLLLEFQVEIRTQIIQQLAGFQRAVQQFL